MDSSSLAGRDKITVLDHGYVRLEHVAPPDPERAIVARARVSRGSTADGVDVGVMIANLLRWGHLTPFETVRFWFEVQAPYFVVRQLERHEALANKVERSRRYTTDDPEFYTPPGDTTLGDFYARVRLEYRRRLDNPDMLPEQARFVLPMATYTVFQFDADARSLMYALFLQRLDGAAQAETRAYARAIWRLFARALPVTAAAFRKKHSFVGLRVSGLDATAHP